MCGHELAIHILGRWGDTESAGPIRLLLASLDERERINAVDALGNIGGTEAEDGVLQLAQDESSDVRRLATYALANLGTSTSPTRLDRMASSDPAGRVRRAAARARAWSLVMARLTWVFAGAATAGAVRRRAGVRCRRSPGSRPRSPVRVPSGRRRTACSRRSRPRAGCAGRRRRRARAAGRRPGTGRS